MNASRHLDWCCVVVLSLVAGGGLSACSGESLPEPTVDVRSTTTIIEPEPGVATLPVVPGSVGGDE